MTLIDLDADRTRRLPKRPECIVTLCELPEGRQ